MTLLPPVTGQSPTFSCFFCFDCSPKVPSEMLYLETSEIPIKYVVIARRLLYLQTILKRHDNEITKIIYTAMKENPLKNDWIELITTDKELLPKESKDDEDIKKLTNDEFKKIVKKCIKHVALKELEKENKTHKQVKEIIHRNVNKPQSYITSEMVSTLFNLRNQCENEFKDNFHRKKNHVTCFLCDKCIDIQEHAFCSDNA